MISLLCIEGLLRESLQETADPVHGAFGLCFVTLVDNLVVVHYQSRYQRAKMPLWFANTVFGVIISLIIIS